MSYGVAIRVVIMGVFGVFALNGSVWAAGSSNGQTPPWNGTVSVPCQQDSESKGSSGGCSFGLRACTFAKPDLVRDIEKNVKTKTDYFYQGLDVNLLETIDPKKPVGTVSMKPVCNPAAGEVSTNHLGDRCGEPVKFTARGVGIFDGYHGNLELAYLGGVWVADVKCYQAQVLNEIKNGKLKVSTGCEALGKDIAALYAPMDQQAKTFLQTLGSSVENFCQQKDMKSFSKTSTPDVCKDFATNPTADTADHLVSACLLAGARSAIEAAFDNLAECEIYGRAYASFVRHIYDENSDFRIQLKREILSPCANGTKAKCPFVCAVTPNPFGCAQECVTGGVRSCYQDRLPSYVTGFIHTHYPESGSCQD